MIPESYTLHNSPAAKSDRRQTDPVVEKVAELIGEMNREVSERLDDYEKVIDIRFAHIDSLIGQLHQDQKDSQSSIVQSIEKIVKLHIDNIQTISKHQDEKIESVRACIDAGSTGSADRFSAVHARLDDHGKRLGDLEKAPDKAAAGKWRTIGDRVLFAFIGLLLAGATAFVMNLISQITGGVK